MSIITYLLFGLVALIIFTGFFVVKQQSAAIVERFGKFLTIRQSGLHFKIPLIDRIAGRISLRILQLDVIVETKTKDDVFVKLKVSVQYKIIQEKVYEESAIHVSRVPPEKRKNYEVDRSANVRNEKFYLTSSPDGIQIVVAGGPGKHSAYIPTFGATRECSVRISNA